MKQESLNKRINNFVDRTLRKGLIPVSAIDVVGYVDHNTKQYITDRLIKMPKTHTTQFNELLEQQLKMCTERLTLQESLITRANLCLVVGCVSLLASFLLLIGYLIFDSNYWLSLITFFVSLSIFSIGLIIKNINPNEARAKWMKTIEYITELQNCGRTTVYKNIQSGKPLNFKPSLIYTDTQTSLAVLFNTFFEYPKITNDKTKAEKNRFNNAINMIVDNIAIQKKTNNEEDAQCITIEALRSTFSQINSDDKNAYTSHVSLLSKLIYNVDRIEDPDILNQIQKIINNSKII